MDNHQQPAPQLDSNGLDNKNIAILIWVGTIFFGFIPSLVVFLVKKDSQFVSDHSREALNWAITTLIAYFCAGILSIIVIGVIFFPIIWICNLIFCILGAVKASETQLYRVPFGLRLIK